MTKFTYVNGSFEIPENYFELTLEHYGLFDGKTEHAFIISQLTGLSQDEVIQIDCTPIVEGLEFIKTKPSEEIERDTKIIIDNQLIDLKEDIGQYQFGQKLIAVKEIDGDNMARMAAVYLQPYVDGGKFDADRIQQTEDKLLQMPVAECYPVIMHIAKGLYDILEYESKMPTPTISAEQRQAGIDKFKILGDFNIIDQLAQGDVTKYEEVLAIEYNVIRNKLLRMNLSSIFEKTYSTILNAKSRR